MEEQKTALLVIDTQIGPLWGTHKKEETLSVILSTIKKAEKENIPVIYVQHEELPGGFMTRGSEFWQFYPGISPRPEDVIIPKKAADSFYQTTLKEELDKREITHLIVVGARTEYCVDTTCRTAVTLGFHVTLVDDGHTSADGILPADMIIKHHNHTLTTVGTPERRIAVTPSDLVTF